MAVRAAIFDRGVVLTFLPSAEHFFGGAACRYAVSPSRLCAACTAARLAAGVARGRLDALARVARLGRDAERGRARGLRSWHDCRGDRRKGGSVGWALFNPAYASFSSLLVNFDNLTGR